MFKTQEQPGRFTWSILAYVTHLVLSMIVKSTGSFHTFANIPYTFANIPDTFVNMPYTFANISYTFVNMPYKIFNIPHVQQLSKNLTHSIHSI